MQTVSTTLNLTVQGTSGEEMPNLVDVAQYGARVINAWWQWGTQATGVAGSNQITLASAQQIGVDLFQNGNGIVIYGAGPICAIPAPAAPVVTPGISQTETVSDAPVIPLPAGSSSYSYVVVARDLHGGLSPASPVTTIQSPAKLGETSVAVSTLNLTNNVMTITTTIPHGLVVGQNNTGTPIGPLIHLKDSSNSQIFSGWWIVNAVPNTNTIQITGTSRNSTTPINATGGSLTYFIGNRVTWTSQAGAWEYVICAQRPGDTSLHVIGVSMPSAGPVGNGYVVNSFVDWGPPLTGINFKLPQYITDACATATQPSNQYLSTTVVSGGGTTSLTLSNKLVNTVNGATVLIDNAPAFLAAAGVAVGNGQTLYISTTGHGQEYYQINSILNLPWAVDVLQVGQLRLGETIIVNSSTSWRAMGSGPAAQFAWKASPTVYVVEANPAFYVQNGAVQFDSVSITTDSNANQALLLVVDSAWGSVFKYLNLYTGGQNDMTGVAVIVRDSTNTVFEYPNFSGGPGYVIDQTWTPLVYMPESQNGSGATGGWAIKNGMFNRRGVFYRAQGGGGMNCEMDFVYIQGAITPFLALANSFGWVNAQLILKRMVMDTSSQAFLALWGLGGLIDAHVILEGTNNGGMGVEAGGGRPTILTGAPAVDEIHASLIANVLGQ